MNNRDLKGILSEVANRINDGKPMPGSGGVLRLREERNQVQLGGTPRSPEAIDKGRVAVEKLLEFVFPAVFGEGFLDLHPRKLIRDIYHQVALDRGENTSQSRHMAWQLRVPPMPSRASRTRFNGNGLCCHRIRSGDNYEKGDPAVKAVVSALALGHDVPALVRFRKLAIGRGAGMPPTGEVNVTNAAGPATEEEARFCLDFAAFNCARLERRLPEWSIHRALLAEPPQMINPHPP
jgi:hypothetical protein